MSDGIWYTLEWSQQDLQMAGIEGENKGKRVVRRDSSRTPYIGTEKTELRDAVVGNPEGYCLWLQ